MGSNQSVGYQEIEIFIDHPKFTNAKIYAQNSVSKLVTSLPIEQNLFKSWQKKLAFHQDISQFALLPEKAHYSQERFCSMKGNAKIIYDSFPYLLKNEIHDRAGRKQSFTEEEIWYLMLAIFSVKKKFSELHINEGNLGNITPQNIFLSQKGEIHVGNYLSWPQSQQTMGKVISEDSRQFIAPEDFIQLSLGMSYCKSTTASQIFAIGITVLSAAILKDNFELYNFQGKKFNFNQALIRIQKLKDSPNYSDTLKAIIQLLCAFQVMDRLQMSQIGQILFRCENSIKAKKKFTAYPLGDKIQNKLRQYRTSQHVLFNCPTLSKLSSIGQQEIVLQSPTNSNFFHRKKNSLNLTQVIFNPNSVINQKKSSNNSESLISSTEQVGFKKTQSDSKEQKPLQRYQQINANYGSNSLSDMEYLNLITIAKQIIIQKPVVVDANRRSDDIEEETTPAQTPTGTPINRSIAGQKEKGFNRQFQVPKQLSKQSLNFNFVQKNPLSKTTNVNLHPNSSYQNELNFKVKSTKSQDPWMGMEASGRQDILKTQNSTITMYIPMNESLNQSLKQSWDSQKVQQNKKNVESSNPKLSFPSLIQQYSKQSSQIQASKLSQKDKGKIQMQILQKFQGQNATNKKLVKFAQHNSLLDLSHQSKILEIDDIDLDCINESNKWSDKIFVGYKEPNQEQILVESVNVSKKTSFVHIDEDQD